MKTPRLFLLRKQQGSWHPFKIFDFGNGWGSYFRMEVKKYAIYPAEGSGESS